LRPLLLVDVDGVLSLFGVGPRPGTKAALVDGIPHVFSLEAAEALIELSARLECVWCTGWEEKADEHLPYLLGLPRGWPHLRFEHASGPGASTAGHWKLAAIDAFAGTRPLAWVDDALDEACHEWAAARHAATLLVPVEPEIGLTYATARDISTWLGGL
jgi:hypothetical protein